MTKILSITAAGLLSVVSSSDETHQVAAKPQLQIAGRTFLQIQAVPNGCGPGNPLYQIDNSAPNSNDTNFKMCRETLITGRNLTLNFYDLSVSRGTVKRLSCRVEGGDKINSHTIHWQQLAPKKPPQDITDPRKAIEVFHMTDPRMWFVGNWHNFKPVRVTYRNSRGRVWTDTIQPNSQIALFIGLTNSPPPMEDVVYTTLPYDPNHCLNGTDVYPQ